MTLTFETNTPISKIRNRGRVLKTLVPKIFGILWEKGQKISNVPFPTYSVQTDEDHELLGHLLGQHRVVLDVYWPMKSIINKVFSAQITDSPDADEPICNRDWAHRVHVVSWCRGEWEEAICADAANARSLSEVYLRHQLAGGTDHVVQ